MKIKITLLKSKAVFIATYSAVRFQKLEWKSGKLKDGEFRFVLYAVPMHLEELSFFQKEWKDKVNYELIETTKSLHTQFLERYHQWYYDRFQIEPIIKPQDAQAVKFIKEALVKLGGTEEEALTVWDMILNNWDKQDTWYVNQTELPQIKRNLNVILKTLKHGKSNEQTGRQARNVSTDYRQSF